MLRDISISFDTCLDDALHFIGLLLDLLNGARQAARGVTEKLVGVGKDNKALLLAEIIQWRRAQSGGGQPLGHGSKSRLDHTRGQELHLRVWIDAEMLDDQSGNDFYGATVGVNPNRFALELTNGFELGPGDECNGGASNEAGKSFDRQSPNHCRHTRADGSVIINFSTD